MEGYDQLGADKGTMMKPKFDSIRFKGKTDHEAFKALAMGKPDYKPLTEPLLSGIEALTKPDFHRLNVHAGRNDRLLHAVLCAYAKHHLDCDDIGWNQLGDILHSAICNEIGDNSYCDWAERIKKD